jgi:hypothetical protein
MSELPDPREEFQASYDALWTLTDLLLTLAARMSPSFSREALEYVETLAPYPEAGDAAHPDPAALLRRRERTHELLRQKLKDLVDAQAD